MYKQTISRSVLPQQYYKDNKEAINQKNQRNYYKSQDAMIQKHQDYYQENNAKVLDNQAQKVLCSVAQYIKKGTMLNTQRRKHTWNM